jgi:hypothetical protein
MRRRLHPIVLGGALVTVLDIAAAFALSASRGGSPLRVLQGIAAGLLGAAAFQGGLWTAALGMLLHAVIAFGAAAVYYGVSRWWSWLVRHPVLSGIAYGVAVHVVMNQIVLPVSRVVVRRPPWTIFATMVLIHMVCVGLPIALAVAAAERRHSLARPGGHP